MNEMSYMSRRVPWIAMALSFLAAGVGHVYCGRIGKGLLLYSAWPIVFLLLFVTAWLTPATSVLVWLMILPTIGVCGVYLYAALDALNAARRTGSTYELKEYNRSWLYALLVTIQLAVPLAMIVATREFIYEAFYLPERSMSPNFLASDRILVNKLRSRRVFPDRGDVIVYRNPDPTPGIAGQNYISRVIAVAGDRVVIKGRDVDVNGKKLERDVVPVESIGAIRDRIEGEVLFESQGGRRYRVMYGGNESDSPSNQEFKTVVPPRSVFVLGDNRNWSKDSRHFGSIHAGDITGYVDYIYYPAETWSRFGATVD
jgi:signal peptidase I